MLEEEPGNPEIKALLEKAIKLSNNMDLGQAKIHTEQLDMTTDEMISELEKYLGDRTKEKEYQQDLVEDMEVRGVVELFNSRIKDILMPNDYKTLFDLGIAYMELELWDEAAGSFKKVMDYLSINNDDNDKLTESKIYYAYSSARSERHRDLDTSIQFLNKLLEESSYDRYKLDVLYYLAICYEMKGDIDNAKSSYKGISNIAPSYRDVEIRLAVIGK
ncbi:MAG: tetratricopeptide repeat protein [Proteobacteria bacterium]|nr:tetratricopeptide repeat protein [Pseudomonadota bacterium]